MSDRRTCTTCGTDQPLTEFPKNSKGLAGRARKCKACVRAYNVVYRSRNAEKLAASKAAFSRSERGKELARARRAKPEAVEKARAYQQRYRPAHRARKLELNRKWREANPEKWDDYRHQRRAKIRGTRIEPIDYAALWSGSCGLCGEPIDPDLKRPDQMSKSVDHIVPLARGGTHTQDNLQFVHLRCNFVKGARTEAAA